MGHYVRDCWCGVSYHREIDPELKIYVVPIGVFDEPDQ